MKAGQIRALALGVITKDDQILVFEGYDPSKNETFYRPLGGAIEFGEYGHEALARELREEIDVELENIRYFGLSENLFTYENQAGHEIILLYEAELADRSIYETDQILGREDDGSPLKVAWKPLNFFLSRKAPLYPDGLLEVLKESTCTTS